MLNTPDGTFLVRDSFSTVGEYTLTLRKDGTEKLIKICQRNGKYGFTEPYEFESVPDMIAYYRNVSLRHYNHILDVKLTYPVSRFAAETDPEDGTVGYSADMVQLVRRFCQLHAEQLTKSEEFERMLDAYDRAEQQRKIKRQAHDAFVAAVLMFETQLNVQLEYMERAAPHEQKELVTNRAALQARLDALHTTNERLCAELTAQKRTVLKMERKISYMKPEKFSLDKRKDKYQRFVDTIDFVKITEIFASNLLLILIRILVEKTLFL